MILKNIISKFIIQTRENKKKPQEIKIERQEWRQTSLLLIPGGTRQEDFMFKAGLGHCLKNNQQRDKK